MPAARTLHLTILLGAVGQTPTTPLSRDAIEALTGASVQSQSEGRTGFQLSFESERRRVVDELLRVFQYGVGAAVRVVILATLGGVLHVLSDGVVLQHQHAVTAAGKTSLAFTGEDLSVLMDLIDRKGAPLPSRNDYVQVNTLLAPYAALGVAPRVIPSPLSDFDDPTVGTPVHTGTDYAWISNAARKVGYIFVLEPGPTPGQSTAYWGPEVQVSAAQPALTLGAGLANNIAALSFTHQTQQHALPRITLKLDNTSVSFPLPDHNPLRPPLTAVPQPPVRVQELAVEDGNLAPARAIVLGLAQAARASDSVSASGQLDVRSYGRFLRPRLLVGVRGASLPYDGLYYVSRVSTELRRGQCSQSFSLKRSGAFPLQPRVSA